MDGIKMFLLLILTVAIPRSIEAADVTTVYKFNTLRSDNPTPQYLNTCSVSVYLQDNDQGLPLFENNHGNSFYRWIPPLYNSSGVSEWHVKRENGTVNSILPLSPTNVDTLEAFKIRPSFRVLAEKQIIRDSTVFANKNDLIKGNNFIRVTFKKNTARTQGIKIKIHYDGKDKEVIYFTFSEVLTVCRDIPKGPDYCPDIKTYGNDEHNNAHENVTVFISVNHENVILLDMTTSNVHFTDIRIPQSFGNPVKVEHVYSYSSSYGDPINYKICEFNNVIEKNKLLVSPLVDLKKNTSLIMLAYVPRNLKYKLCNDYLINAYIAEVAIPTDWKIRLIGNSTLLECQELNQSNIIKHFDNEHNIDARWERVLLKIKIRSPDNWIGLKQIHINISHPLMFIANIWEGRDEQKVKISNKTNCWSSDQNVLYSTPAVESNNNTNNASLSQYSSCYNGGLLHGSYCVCPPGFLGNQCDTPCGRNLFGSNCSIICSRSSSECKGMVFCTPMYGCSCYPGYYGAQCTQKCEEGYYGANCKQSCSQGCESGCDIYSGNCRGSCKTPYLIGPRCDEFHSYLRDPPMVVDSSFTSIHLSINLSTSNIIKPLNYDDSTMFYIVQYREETNQTWTNCSHRIFKDQTEKYVVDDLTPGHIYFFRVLLVDSTMKTHDPNIAKISKGNTKCNISNRGDDTLKASKITNTSVYLIWEPEQGNECPAISYILVIEEEVDDLLEKSHINNISKTFYEIKDLVPSQLYRVNLKKLTLHGESDTIASINVTTDDTIDFTRELPGVKMLKEDNRVVLKWFASAIYKTFYVKYILNRHLSCSNDHVNYPIVVNVTNQTTFSLSFENLDPYSHYYIFVTPDVRQNLNFNNFTIITRSQLPKVAPTLLENKMKVTNESIYLYVEKVSSCEGMNGVFLKYFINYYNNYSKSMHMFETVDNPIVLMNLHPSTEYFAKIYYVNNIGYNKDKYLEYNFTTKSTIVLVAKELTAYKTSADLIGLRWKLPETNLTITGSNIGLHTDIWNKTISFESGLDTMKCRAWPSYICFDITDLRPNVKYNITVDLLSNESSEIGSSNPISAITKEGIASPVENLKMEKIFQTNITISWKIPYMLNGILRKFVIEVEHLSSFNEALCCENLLVLNHEVSGEQEEYSHVLSNVHSASSYHITIRPFTKRLGSPLSKIVETPPPLQSLKYMPLVKLNNRNVEFIEIDDADSSGTDHELVNDILILVQELSHGSESNGNLGHLGFRREISQILKSNSWWLTHVCIPSEENCSIDLGVTPEESEDPKYGMVVKKQLLVGQEYRVIIVQVNQYMSARSYTIAQSNKLTIEAADVTTVYKFNTLRSDNPTLQYLNTCSVSVYMQDNDQGLPLFENHHGNSFYRWIPPLYNYTSGGSEWQFKTNTGTLGFIFPFNLNIIFPTNVNSNELFRKMSMAILPCSRILAEKLTNTNGYVSDNTNDLNEGSTFVGVTFTRKTAQIQGIQLRIIYYTTAPNEDMFTYIFVTGTLISVCCNNPFVANSCSNDYTYGENEDGIMHDTITVYMSVNSERVILIVASDSTIYKVHFTDMHIPPKFGKPIKVCHRYIYSKTYGDQVSYKVVQLNSNENSMMLVSPLLDLKRDSTALFMLVYVLKNDSKLSHETLINAHIDEVATVNWKLQFGKSNQLKYQEVNQATIMNYSDQKSNDSPFKRVLLKINVRNPDNWKGLKQIRIKMNQPLMFIANIWEGRDEHKVNISNKTNCWNSDKNVMYSTPAIKSSNNASLSSQYSSCYNGGHLHASYCVCPPGFIGNQCETPCGRNLFGSNCSIICSRSSSECQGMVFCTPMYGCSCYPGYYGAQCTQKCEEGFYGANCKQPCSQGCESGCDNNSGNCRGSCKTPYLIGPKCDEFPSYLRDPPMVVDSNFTSVHLSINLSTSNIIKPLNYHNSPMFYIVQYREETNKTWINCSRGIFIGQIESYVVDGLKPGHIYFFKVLLVDSTMKTHDPNIAKISKGNTKCNSDQDGSVKATEITNTSVYLTWKPEQGNECPAISYILVIEEDVDDFLEISQINNISRTFYEIKDLVPSQLYRINLKKITLHGESDPIASIKVTTDDTIDFTREIPGVTMIRDYNRVVLKWYASAIYKTFYVKYILNRHLSCSNDDVYYPLVVHVTKETTFSLSDENLEPYSHYYIFVTPDVRRNLNFNNFTFTTGSTLPTVTPNLLENKMKVTTESIHLYVANASSCEGMNGVFLKYFISYYNNYSKSMHMFETVDNPIVLMNLHPSTEYFAKIYYVNNIGYNKDKYLEYNFTTKSTIVLVAKELTAYKTSADLIGLRWKLPETNLTITGSNIGLHTDIWNKTISFESGLDTMKCRAWPSYICFDITDLRPNVKYNITVDLLSNESSEIGSSNPISAITKEGIASPVENLKMEKIFQTNITISWKIPYMLNGILRKFVIEVEHLSSFNEALCCENLLVLNHEVSGEQEEYSHVLSNVHSASSYHITIRPFTKRLGSPLSKIVETPPPLQSLKYMPLVKLNNRNVEFIEIDDADSSGTDHELVNDILILVQELSHGSESNGNLGHLGFRREISQILKSNSWWLTHVCIPSEENCSIDLGVTPEESEDPKYGMVVKKQLLVGQEYRVIIVQVNQYMSARSYTIAQSNKLTIGDG